MDNVSEDRVLVAAEMTQNALAMNRALLDADLHEARSRATLLDDQAISVGDPSLKDATGLVMLLLGPPGAAPSLGCGAAMLALSTKLGEWLGNAP